MVPGHLPAPTIVGRSAELVLFERVIADARTGVPSVVLVGGDAGIGKTTIVSGARRERVSPSTSGGLRTSAGRPFR